MIASSHPQLMKLVGDYLAWARNRAGSGYSVELLSVRELG